MSDQEKHACIHSDNDTRVDAAVRLVDYCIGSCIYDMWPALHSFVLSEGRHGGLSLSTALIHPPTHY